VVCNSEGLRFYLKVQENIHPYKLWDVRGGMHRRHLLSAVLQHYPSLENQSPKSLPVTKMSRALLIIYTKRDSEREVKILLERKQKP
jgi:hypothetical protein